MIISDFVVDSLKNLTKLNYNKMFIFNPALLGYVYKFGEHIRGENHVDLAKPAKVQDEYATYMRVSDPERVVDQIKILTERQLPIAYQRDIIHFMLGHSQAHFKFMTNMYLD